MLFSPILIGPASALIKALGLTIVPRPIVTFPIIFDSIPTKTAKNIVILNQKNFIKVNPEKNMFILPVNDRHLVFCVKSNRAQLLLNMI